MAQKTPVSLMNELAKANKMNPEYKVIEESGPAHKRNFKVELTLVDVGTWQGQSTSIKNARHVAARIGLENCGLCMPEKKPKIQQVNLTPTVEVNGLAMKLGKPTQYHELQSKISHFHPPVGMGYPGLQMQQLSRMHNGPLPRAPYHMQQSGHNHYRPYRPYHPNSYYHRSGPPHLLRTHCVKLVVGDQEFHGEGKDKTKARNDAALKAIKVLREELAALAVSNDKMEESSHKPEEQKTVQNGQDADTELPDSAPAVKSEISQVYEIAIKRKLRVNFEDVQDSGPAHMKRFVVRATVGVFQTVGEGSKKKDAKLQAARKMLEELKKLPELPQEETAYKRSGPGIRRGPRIPHKPKGEIDPTLNPISILGQILQRRHESPPTYKVLQEKILPQGQDFVMQVTVGQHEATGSGPNKKEAKKRSAEAMLQLIGFRSSEVKPAEATASPQGEKANKHEHPPAAFNGTQSSTSQPTTILGRQLKPGLLPMVPELVKQTRSDMMNSVVAPIAQVKEEHQEPTLHGGLNRAPGAPVGKSAQPGKHLTPVQKLLHIAEVEGFRVQFTDYPKEIKGTREFLTLVTVSSIPPLTCYGSGATVEASREEAASNALKPLLQLGLDRTSTLKSLEEGQAKQGGNKSQPSPSGDTMTCEEGRENPTTKD